LLASLPFLVSLRVDAQVAELAKLTASDGGPGDGFGGAVSIDGDRAGASAMLRRILGDGEPPVRLLAFLASNVRGALHIAELKEAGLKDDDISRRLGMPAWLVGKRQHRGRARDLVQALWILRRLDLELKSPAPPEAAFEAALLEIASVSSRS